MNQKNTRYLEKKILESTDRLIESAIAASLLGDEAKEKEFRRGAALIGEIARNLDAIYSYLTRRLIRGDVEKDDSAFDETVRLLSDLKEAWEGIAYDEKSQKIPNVFMEGPRSLSAQITA